MPTEITFANDAASLPALPVGVADAIGAAIASASDAASSAEAALASQNIAKYNADSAAASVVAAAAAIIPYYGPRSSDPTTRPSGAAMVEGDIYYSTTLHGLRIYSVGAWRPILSGLAISRGEAWLALKANSTGSINWFGAVQSALPASESDDSNIRFMDSRWPIGGAAWAFVNTTLTAALAGVGGFSPSQLAALQAQALTMRENT